MPDIADLLPPTDFASRPAAPMPAPSVGLWQIGKDAASSEWVGSWLLRKFDRAEYLYDPYFELSENRVKELGAGLPTEYWDRFSEADSDGEAQAIRRQLLEVHGARERLASAGWTGRAAQIGANIVDPAAIALTLGTAGLGGEVAYGGKAARLAMLARAGLAVGGTNAALEGLRAMEDPEVGPTQILAAGAGGFGFGVGSALTRGASRGARVLGGGLGQAIPTLGIDAIDALSDDDRTARDVLFAGSFSFAMGGILNGLHRTTPEERAAAIRVRKRIELEDARSTGARITLKGEAYFRDVLPEGEAATTARLTEKLEAAEPTLVPQSAFDDALRRLDAFEPGHKFNREEADAVLKGTGYRTENQGWPTTEDMRGYIGNMAAHELRKAEVRTESGAAVGTPDPTSPGPQFSVGAATLAEIESGVRATQRGEKLPGDLDLSNVTDAPSFNPKVSLPIVGDVHLRPGMAGLNGQSESPAVRRLSAMLVEDPIAKADGSPSRQSASEWGRLRFEVEATNFLRQHKGAFEEWAERNGKPITRMRPFASSKAFAEFSEEVGRAVRRPEGEYTTDPAINRSASYIRDGLDKLWMMQNRYQVPGFDQVTPYHNYLTRIWSLSKLNAVTGKYGAQAVENLVATAMMNRTPDIGPQRAAIFAKGMLRTVREAKLGSELDRARVLDLPDTEVLRKAIRDAVPTITEDALNDVLYHVQPKEGENLPPRARRRVVLDETASIGVTDKNGQTSRLAVEDLLENDAAKVYARYARDAYGRSAVAEVIRANRTGPEDTLDSVQSLIERVRRQAEADYGVTTADKRSQADREVDRIETAFKSVLGHRLTGSGRLAEGGRILRAINYLLLGGRFGLNNTVDIASAVGEAGFGTTLRAMPSIARLIASAISGKMKDETIREVEAVWAAGTDHFRGSIGQYLDHDARVHAFGEAADDAIRAGARSMSYVNFMAPIESFTGKLAAILAEQRWLDYSRRDHLPSVGRLADMGLTKSEAALITGEMKIHATTDTGLFGRKIIAANVGQWDPEIAAKYIGAVDRWSRSAVVRNDIGQMSRWMTLDFGQILMQFKAFTVSAYEKTLIRNVRRRDLAAFNTFALTTLVGALSYIANEVANSIGRPDAERYRREKLQTDQIAKAAFQRASWTTFLPSAIDSAVTGLGYDPLFAGGRFSGLSTNLVTGNPSYSTLDAAITKLPAAVTSGMHGDKRFTRGDFHTIRRLIPFQNAFGVKNVLDAIELDLPRREK